ncbi:phosphoglucosamine mutase [Pajaroellobacter abortibovis]|uniref:Phosphoglucosamine mutase n=1 Tax=Pajaroellobacter abortibovis TaxID=1882918 RepID=A0A1L6MXX0_9BACT|nr:phosphoglucosamine mutase [Pajaroellobacter abortibovis]
MAGQCEWFGTDGMRGVANEYPITPEAALKLGRAITWIAGRRKPHTPRILIGKDTRLSGYMLETAIASGVCSMGGRVILCGPLPTPAIAHLTVSMRADTGVVISASHNPYSDNGIKLFGEDGFKLPKATELEIEHLLNSDQLRSNPKTGPGIGRAEKLEDARGRYVVFVKTTFPRELSLENIRIAIDCAHGSAYKAAPLVFQELGATVTTLGARPNGVNINKDCGALHPTHIRAEVVKKKADLGIALDGDADRVLLIDENGQLVDGDRVMAMCADRMWMEGKLQKNTVVATVMSNLGLERALARRQTKLIRTPVGDRNVVEAMRKKGCNLGGEQSGHLIFSDYISTGDGIIAALQVLAIMVRTGKPLSLLAQSAMDRVPQVLESILFSCKKPLSKMIHLQTEVAKVSKALGKEGRVLIRWSGTEPKLRIMVEGPQEDTLHEWVKELIAAAHQDILQPI